MSARLQGRLLRVGAAGTAVAAAASVALVGITASPVSGALTTRCVGFAEGVTVPGDLVVPAFESCSLTGVTIEGSVRVARNADLVLDAGSSVGGDAAVAPGGFLDATESTVAGTLIVRGGFAASVETSSVGADVRIVGSDDESAGPGLLSIESSDVAGTVIARTGEVSIESSRIGADVRANGAVFVDVVDSTVTGGLRLVNAEFGGLVCASEVYGDSLVRANGYGVQLGGGGGIGACDDVNFFGGDLVVRDNAASEVGLAVSGNIVAGSLTGSGNDPAPFGAGNRVRGAVGGQFADLAPGPDDATPPTPSGPPGADELDPTPPAPAVAARTSAIVAATTAAADDAGVEESSAVASPPADAEEVIAQRRAGALAAAAAAGPAGL